MKHNVMLTVLLSILFTTFRLTDDIVRGFEKEGASKPHCCAHLYMMGKGVGVGGNIAKSSGAFFFIWTIIALGATALFSVILSVRGLWSLRWGQSR